MAGDDPTRSYVERVRANTRAYIEELLAEIGRLRAEADSGRVEQQQLRRELDQVRAEMRRFHDRFVEVEQQNSNLAALYAASYQLHASLARTDVLATIQEIVVNLVGSEELAILGLGAGGFEWHGGMGVDAGVVARLRPDVGLVATALASGRPAAAGPEGAGADGVTACIPLVLGGRTLALVAIFRLLPQKPALQQVDLELFALLGHHAAAALHSAELHEHAQHGEASC